MSDEAKEIIIVRSLTDSDLGLFAAHRASATSKQRAININAPIAKRLLSRSLFEAGGGEIECVCQFKDIVIREPRALTKVHKNWRLGGRKIEGGVFATLDAKDFIIIRSLENNDGTHPLFISFVARSDNRVVHAGFVRIVERALDRSMALVEEGSDYFEDLAPYTATTLSKLTETPEQKSNRLNSKNIPAMPQDKRADGGRKRTIAEKIRSPHIMEKMLSVASDLSGPAQLQFMDTVRLLAEQLRQVLLETGGIVSVERNHKKLWAQVAGQRTGFVDGGLANLSMLGSAPIAARVGGYIVRPGDRSENREDFVVLKQLIDELYSYESAGVYQESFPDISALRDAARISIEAAGAIMVIDKYPDVTWVFVHGALVNPVSRYSDIMSDRKILHEFPDFSASSLSELLPSFDPDEGDRPANFISVYQKQLELLERAGATVCGVIEREATTTSVCNAVLSSLKDEEIAPLLPEPPAKWKNWFRQTIDPSGGAEYEGQRITDSLLFRCVLEPGEALSPVAIDRNEMRRAPEHWKSVIIKYPKPLVSYLQASEWSAPIRIEFFEKDRLKFYDAASYIMHCALLLPKYSFPVGLDIVDKYAKIPNWMSRTISTHAAVRALKIALESKDQQLFDTLRRMMCGSSREWLMRPNSQR